MSYIIAVCFVIHCSLFCVASKCKGVKIPQLPLPEIDESSGIAKAFHSLESHNLNATVIQYKGGSNRCYEWTCKSKERRGETCQWCLPFVLVAGISKCGTTAICKKLATHPHIKTFRKKEINMFTKFDYSLSGLERKMTDNHPENTGI
jgi:hypothetical protein